MGQSYRIVSKIYLVAFSSAMLVKAHCKLSKDGFGHLLCIALLCFTVKFYFDHFWVFPPPADNLPRMLLSKLGYCWCCFDMDCIQCVTAVFIYIPWSLIFFKKTSPLKYLNVYIIFQNMVSDSIPEKIVSIWTARIWAVVFYKHV